MRLYLIKFYVPDLLLEVLYVTQIEFNKIFLRLTGAQSHHMLPKVLTGNPRISHSIVNTSSNNLSRLIYLKVPNLKLILFLNQSPIID